MSSGTIRDPLADHLITPQNGEDGQDVRAADRPFDVNVASGQVEPTVPELAELLDESGVRGP
jgi:hypothetical protein